MPKILWEFKITSDFIKSIDQDTQLAFLRVQFIREAERAFEDAVFYKHQTDFISSHIVQD